MNFSFAIKHKIIDILIEKKEKKKLIVKNIFIIVKKIR